MPVYSMTGYASAQKSGAAAGSESESPRSGAGRLGLEIRSVNSRFLDLSFRLPDELRGFEPALRELLTKRLKRGKVEVRATIDQGDTSALPQLSPPLLQRLNSLQDSVRAWMPGAAPLRVVDVIRLCPAESAADADWEALVPAAAQQAVDELLAARAREGKRLAALLFKRLVQLRALAEQAGPLIPQLVEQQRQRFIDRWNEAMGHTDGTVTAQAGQDRALTEATAYAIRIDVAEELGRLASHLDEIESLLGKGGEIGKRLDFLIQELHREANTLGSKSTTLELTRISVDMKVLIEQMREQVQNIE